MKISDNSLFNEDSPLLNSKKSKSFNARRASPWHIILPLFALTFCFGALYAPMLQFYSVIFCYRYYRQQTGDADIDIPFEKCTIPEVQSLVSEAQAVIMFLTYGTTMLFASYYGTLSDRKGRRLVLMISSFGNIILMLSYIATIQFTDIFGISLLFIIPVIRGILAGDSVLIAAAQAYISDCTTPSERTIMFGNMMGAMFLGATLGPSAASFLMKETDSITIIFSIVLAIHILFLMYTWLFLPESNRNIMSQASTTNVNKESQTILQRLNIFSALSILYKASSKRANRFALPIIACIQFLLNIISLPPSILYAMLEFGWTAYEGGIYLSLVSFTRLLNMLVVLPLLSKLFSYKTGSSTETVPSASTSTSDEQQESIYNRLKEFKSTSSHDFLYICDNESTSSSLHNVDSEENTNVEDEERSEEAIKQSIIFDTSLIRVGLIVETICLVVNGLVTTSFGFMVAGACQSFALLASPSLRSIMTTLVPHSEVGRLLGAMAILESFSMVISQLTINTIYSASVATMPTLTFYVCAAIAAIALILSFFVYPSPTTKEEEA
ncbi:MAG: major facilitator superfamily domain-containing protein [Benjaminiella poitrasii]|nr:MAG: major facilitator superfamily domain-containing protein [Benjaminiella poitrasii]